MKNDNRVVVGDLLVLKPGQELCADVRLVEITSGPTRRIQMELDEAPLDALRYRSVFRWVHVHAIPLCMC